MKLRVFLASLAVVTALPAKEVTAEHVDSQVVFRAGEREIMRYQGEPGPLPRPEIPRAFTRGGYIQSIHTPEGRLITDDFPADHMHHHGVWNAWTKTEFEGRHPDFWNMGAETGRVEFVALDKLWQKDGRAGLVARHRSVDLTADPAKTVLLETWEITVSAPDDLYVIDFTSTQTCATASPLELPEYRYGGLGFRGNIAWNGAGNCKFLGSSGLTDRLKLDTSRERWCRIGGEVGGKACGIYILGHPRNFRFPQPVRANPDQPFFCFAPTQLGAMEIKPDEKFLARYRLVIADGPPDAKAAEAWWQDYADVR